MSVHTLHCSVSLEESHNVLNVDSTSRMFLVKHTHGHTFISICHILDLIPSVSCHYWIPVGVAVIPKKTTVIRKVQIQVRANGWHQVVLASIVLMSKKATLNIADVLPVVDDYL